MAMQLPSDFREFLKLLDSHSVDYLLIGGYAVAYHGYPRATGDLDIWVAPSTENAMRLVGAIREFGFDTPELSENLFVESESIVRMGYPPMRIEVFTAVSGVGFDECDEECALAEIDGVSVRIIGLAHLKANKLASGRHKDLDDIENLP